MASNILTVYYSRKGKNYWNGSIVDLKKGNAETAAEFIQKAVGGELFEIETTSPYPDDYQQCCAQAQKERKEIARPEIKDASTRSTRSTLFSSSSPVGTEPSRSAS